MRESLYLLSHFILFDQFTSSTFKETRFNYWIAVETIFKLMQLNCFSAYYVFAVLQLKRTHFFFQQLFGCTSSSIRFFFVYWNIYCCGCCNIKIKFNQKSAFYNQFKYVFLSFFISFVVNSILLFAFYFHFLFLICLFAFLNTIYQKSNFM